MKFTIKTVKLQEMVSKAVKGASNNKMIPITQMMALELKKKVFRIITTDATNYLYIRESKVEGDDFYVTLEAEKFSKLIARMTCENITLELKDNALEVSGNGTYLIELPLDEEGELIKFPDPLTSVKLGKGKSTGTLNLTTAQAILMTVKPSLAVTLENPQYTGYYIGDRVVATDTYKIASMDLKLFDTPKLISPEMFNLLSVMSDEHINYDIKDNVIVFSTPDCVVYGTAMEGLDDYAIDAISALVDTKFNSMCKLSKASLLQVLDRLSLFVTTYDKNGIYLTFTKEGLQISSKSSNGVELVEYMESKKFKAFTGFIDIEMLTSQIKAQAGDVVEMYYGVDNAIKLVDGNITQIVALLEEDEIDEI